MTAEKQLKFEDLKDGDVLVMMGPKSVSWPKIIAEGDFNAALIQAIMYLSDSDVCHGAIYSGLVGTVHSLIDDGESGVAQHRISTEGDKPEDKPDDWYVRRLRQASDLEPVIKQAKAYCKPVKTAYDWELLGMLGLLLLYRKVTPNTPFFQGLLVLLEKLVVTLDHLIHDKSVDYFVCSQFVAACFDQAGSDYALQVKDGDLQPTTPGTVIDQCLEKINTGAVVNTEAAASAITPLQPSDIKMWLEGSAQNTHEVPGATLDDTQLVSVCDRFLRWFFETNARALGLTEVDWETPKKRFELAQTMAADFVTPADLKSHCTNLEPVGTIQFFYGDPISP